MIFGSFFLWRPIFNGFRLFFFVATDFQRFSAPFFRGNRFSTVFGSFFSWQPIFNGFQLLFFMATVFQRFSAPFFRGNRFSTVFGSFFSWRPIFNGFQLLFFVATNNQPHSYVELTFIPAGAAAYRLPRLTAGSSIYGSKTRESSRLHFSFYIASIQ